MAISVWPTLSKIVALWRSLSSEGADTDPKKFELPGALCSLGAKPALSPSYQIAFGVRAGFPASQRGSVSDGARAAAFGAGEDLRWSSRCRGGSLGEGAGAPTAPVMPVPPLRKSVTEQNQSAASAFGGTLAARTPPAPVVAGGGTPASEAEQSETLLSPSCCRGRPRGCPPTQQVRDVTSRLP